MKTRLNSLNMLLPILLSAMILSCGPNPESTVGSITLTCTDSSMDLSGAPLEKTESSDYVSRTISLDGQLFVISDGENTYTIQPTSCIFRTLNGNITSVVLEFPGETVNAADIRVQAIAREFRLDASEFAALRQIDTVRPGYGKQFMKNFDGEKLGRSFSLAVIVWGTGSHENPVCVRVEVASNANVAETQ